MNIKTTIILLMFFSSISYAKKPVMAVVDFTNQTNAGWWTSNVGRELSSMLTNEMASTKAFKMVERQKLDNLIREQDLGASGRVSKGTAAKLGRLTGAQYLVTGTVSAYEENVAGKSGGFSFKGLSLGGKKNSAYLAVDLRVVDTTTGEIVDVRTVEGSSKGGGLNIGLSRGGFSGDLGGHKKTPTGKAIRAAIIEISDYLECSMVKKSRCMAEYDKKEKKRREASKSALSLE